MTKFRILSGEFRLVLKEKDFESAAKESIRLHIESGHCTRLGEITMAESDNDAMFFCTQNLIDSLHS